MVRTDNQQQINYSVKCCKRMFLKQKLTGFALLVLRRALNSRNRPSRCRGAACASSTAVRPRTRLPAGPARRRPSWYLNRRRASVQISVCTRPASGRTLTRRPSFCPVLVASADPTARLLQLQPHVSEAPLPHLPSERRRGRRLPGRPGRQHGGEAAARPLNGVSVLCVFF